MTAEQNRVWELLHHSGDGEIAVVGLCCVSGDATVLVSAQLAWNLNQGDNKKYQVLFTTFANGKPKKEHSMRVKPSSTIQWKWV